MMIHLLGAMGGFGTTVTVTGASINAFDSSAPFEAEAGISVETDGKIYSLVNSVPSVINEDTDWIIPHEAADGLYEVRVTNVTGDAFTSSPGSNGTWFSLSSGRTWRVQNTTSSSTTTTNFTLEIRYNGGSVLDSGAIELNAQNTS